LKAVIDYYGRCGPPDAHGTVPLLALAGEADNWGNPANNCRTFVAGLRPDQPVEMKTYPGVAHAFDNTSQAFTSFQGHNLGYDANAAADSYERVRAFLAKWLPAKTGDPSPLALNQHAP